MKKILALTCLLHIGLLSAQSLIVSTIAGNGKGGFIKDGGLADTSEINRPCGIKTDAAGNIYFTDYLNNRIRKIDKAGIITTIAGNGIQGYSGDNGPATNAELHLPSGIAIDSAGNVYITDSYNNRIRKIDKAGTITTIAGIGGSGTWGDGGPATAAYIDLPTGIAIDDSGNIYIAEEQDELIRKINTKGIIYTIAGTGVTGYNGDNIPATTAKLNAPSEINLDDSGNVYIADGLNYRIRKIDTKGIIHTVAGNGYSGYSGDGGIADSAELNEPVDVFINHSAIYIADYGNNRVRKVDSKGIISTIAGKGVSGYSGDGGLADSAKFNAPSGITMDSTGGILISDYNNNRIRKLTTGTVGINQLFKNNTVSVYPNPGNGVFNFQLSNTNQKGEIEIYNILGKRVYSKQLSIVNSQLIIDISNQPAGIYLYRIISDKGEALANGKLVIE